MSQQLHTALRIGYLALRPKADTPAHASSGAVEPHTRLIAAGISRLFIDVLTDNGPKDQLDAAIAAMGEGDLLVTPSLDMLAASVADLLQVHARLDSKGCGLLVLEIAGGVALNTQNAEGRAILGALAVFETLGGGAGAAGRLFPGAMPGQTSTASIEARAVLRSRGRPPLAQDTSQEVTRLFTQGVRATDIAARLGIGRASVYRILQQETPPGRAVAMADRLRGG